jgi:hypothetical protein
MFFFGGGGGGPGTHVDGLPAPLALLRLVIGQCNGADRTRFIR